MILDVGYHRASIHLPSTTMLLSFMQQIFLELKKWDNLIMLWLLGGPAIGTGGIVGIIVVLLLVLVVIVDVAFCVTKQCGLFWTIRQAVGSKEPGPGTSSKSPEEGWVELTFHMYHSVWWEYACLQTEQFDVWEWKILANSSVKATVSFFLSLFFGGVRVASFLVHLYIAYFMQHISCLHYWPTHYSLGVCCLTTKYMWFFTCKF